MIVKNFFRSVNINNLGAECHTKGILFALVESAMAGEKACFFCGEEPSNTCGSCQVSKSLSVKMLDKFSNVPRNSPIYDECQIKFEKVLALS